jgi:tRNA pseudouridine55 synthase
MYSAVKVDGRRLYELARAGEEVERTPRSVTVNELLLRDFSATQVRLSVRCSKGFFVRVLAEELGEKLGCGAHLVALRRTQSGPFSLADAVPLAELMRAPEAAAARLLSNDQALIQVPAVTVTEAEAVRVRHGGVVEVAPTVKGLVRVLGPTGELLAVAEGREGRLVYRRVLAVERG